MATRSAPEAGSESILAQNQDGRAEPPGRPSAGLWPKFRRHHLAIAGMVIISLAVLLAVLAGLLPIQDPAQPDVSNILARPSSAHWLGTDSLGRDSLSRITFGAQVSLLVGVGAVGLALVIGLLLGLLAGYFGGWVDSLISRVIDMFLAFPSILLAIAIMAVLPPSLFNIILAIAISDWTRFARLVRGETLSIKEREFVESGRAIGANDARLIFRTILPNALGPIIVTATFSMASAILTEASLSFLGLGVQPPTPSWGSMLADAKAFMRDAPWASIFPGLAIMFVILGFNFLGDGLRDALDPNQRL